MDAAEAVLIVVAPVGAAALALGRIVLNRHLRVLDRIEESQKETARIQAEQLAELKRLADGVEELGEQLADRRLSELTGTVKNLHHSLVDEDEAGASSSVVKSLAAPHGPAPPDPAPSQATAPGEQQRRARRPPVR